MYTKRSQVDSLMIRYNDKRDLGLLTMWIKVEICEEEYTVSVHYFLTYDAKTIHISLLGTTRGHVVHTQ